MRPVEMSEWDFTDLFDVFRAFRDRGEGTPELVKAALVELEERGGISDEASHKWQDAIEWREMGHWFKAWDIGPMPEGPHHISEVIRHYESTFFDEEEFAFRAWRRDVKARPIWEL